MPRRAQGGMNSRWLRQRWETSWPPVEGGGGSHWAAKGTMSPTGHNFGKKGAFVNHTVTIMREENHGVCQHGNQRNEIPFNYGGVNSRIFNNQCFNHVNSGEFPNNNMVDDVDSLEVEKMKRLNKGKK